MSKLPLHSKEMSQECDRYLNAIGTHLTTFASSLAKNPQYRQIFNTTTASYVVLRAFSRRQIPPLRAAIKIAQRVPLHIACSQCSAVYIDLRRFIELVTIFIYFSEHPIEWRALCLAPDKGYIKTDDKPITYCAHRETAWYLNYAGERMTGDKSGLGQKAISDLRSCYRTMSSHVHPAGFGINPGPLLYSFETIDHNDMKSITKEFRSTATAAVISLAAVQSKRFSQLRALERAWFDWLIGSERSKCIRSGPFGIE